MIAQTPETPYYAVIFSSLRTDGDQGYSNMSTLMLKLASQQKGYLGVESAREALGITVSYWQDLDSIKNWKEQAQHLIAQKYGQEKWYSDYKVRIAKVERDYSLL